MFYVSPDGKLNAIDVAEAGSKLETSPPKLLFDVRGDFAVSADGSRFLAVIPVENDSARSVTVVLNWGLGQNK